MNSSNKDRDFADENKKQSMRGSGRSQGFPQSGSEGDSIGSSLGEGKARKLPAKDEDARKQDERDERGYDKGSFARPE